MVNHQGYSSASMYNNTVNVEDDDDRALCAQEGRLYGVSLHVGVDRVKRLGNRWTSKL